MLLVCVSLLEFIYIANIQKIVLLCHLYEVSFVFFDNVAIILAPLRGYYIRRENILQIILYAYIPLSPIF